MGPWHFWSPRNLVLRPVVPGCAGCAMAHPIFGWSVNPISTRGDRLYPPNYYWHTRIFRPSDGPESRSCENWNATSKSLWPLCGFAGKIDLRLEIAAIFFPHVNYVILRKQQMFPKAQRFFSNKAFLFPIKAYYVFLPMVKYSLDIFLFFWKARQVWTWKCVKTKSIINSRNPGTPPSVRLLKSWWINKSLWQIVNYELF